MKILAGMIESLKLHEGKFDRTVLLSKIKKAMKSVVDRPYAPLLDNLFINWGTLLILKSVARFGAGGVADFFVKVDVGADDSFSMYEKMGCIVMSVKVDNSGWITSSYYYVKALHWGPGVLVFENQYQKSYSDALKYFFGALDGDRPNNRSFGPLYTRADVNKTVKKVIQEVKERDIARESSL